MASFTELSNALQDSLENIAMLAEIAVPTAAIPKANPSKSSDPNKAGSKKEPAEEVSLDPLTEIQNPELAALTEIAKNLAIIGQILAQWAKITSNNP